ncbi:MAG: hypothetical protein ABJP70_03405 [Erythrobacter sp.]
MSLSLLLAPALAIQSTGNTVRAIKNDDPETWVVEYPRLIQPYVAEYRRCLTSQHRYIRGVADFEAQAREDVPRCLEVRVEMVATSNAEFTQAKTRLSVQDVEQLFENISLIHIARGRDLDQQFTIRVASSQNPGADYDPEKPMPLVIEMQDASVIKAAVDAANILQESKDTKTESK